MTSVAGEMKKVAGVANVSVWFSFKSTEVAYTPKLLQELGVE